MSAPLFRHTDMSASLPESATAPMPLASVSPSGLRRSAGINSARFQVMTPPGQSASDGQFILEATLEGTTWVEVGSAVTGPGISALLDVRGYFALRVAVKALDSSAGRRVDIAILATPAEPGTP